MSQAPHRQMQHRWNICAVFAAAALLSVLLGLALFVFADDLGLDADTSRTIALAFIVAGAIDAVVLQLWERSFGPQNPETSPK